MSEEEKRIIKDERFRHVHYDPRFQRQHEKERKFKVDKRFEGMFKDPKFHQTYGRDKYGRKLKDESSSKDIERFYELEEDEEQNDEEQIESEEVSEDSESEVETDHEEDYGEEIKTEEKSVPLGSETSRLAIVNLPWDKLRAIDLFVLLNSFLPSGGILHKVSIYLSDFGAEKLKEEEKFGPRNIWSDKVERTIDDDNETEEGSAFNDLELRRYELKKLKYYFAEAIFDCTETASKVYEQCDGIEYQSSGSMLDLRFIPNEISFADRKLKDEATSMPSNYEAPEFTFDAAGHSKVQLSWDAEDYHRTKLFKQRLTPEEIENADFDAFLASSDEEGDADKYKSLLVGLQGTRREEESGGVEIVFQSGLKRLGKDIADRSEKDEGAFETQHRKLKEKRKEKIDKELYGDIDPAYKDDPFFQESFGEEEKVKMKKSKKKGKGVEDEQGKAELELLVMEGQDEDAQGDKRGYDLKDLVSSQKPSKKRKRKGQEITKDDFKVDVDDVRFNAMFQNPLFSIDPTSSSFAPTEGMGQILKASQSRSELSRAQIEADAKAKRKDLEEHHADSKPKTSDVDSIVKKLKARPATKSKKLGSFKVQAPK